MGKGNFFAMISRMQYIDRWALMRNTRQENLSEHSLMAAVIAHALCVIGNRRLHKNLDGNRAAVLALYHDAPEILTGDLPTPVKYYNPEIRDAYREVETVSARRLLSMLPDALRPAYEPLLLEDPESGYHAVVKAADKLSAYIKCVEELKAGNSEFRQAAEQTRQALEASPLPEVGYFLEHFMPGFELTLDELR